MLPINHRDVWSAHEMDAFKYVLQTYPATRVLLPMPFLYGMPLLSLACSGPTLPMALIAGGFCSDVVTLCPAVF